jgi:hypothetical protein
MTKCFAWSDFLDCSIHALTTGESFVRLRISDKLVFHFNLCSGPLYVPSFVMCGVVFVALGLIWGTSESKSQEDGLMWVAETDLFVTWRA